MFPDFRLTATVTTPVRLNSNIFLIRKSGLLSLWWQFRAVNSVATRTIFVVVNRSHQFQITTICLNVCLNVEVLCSLAILWLAISSHHMISPDAKGTSGCLTEKIFTLC